MGVFSGSSGSSALRAGGAVCLCLAIAAAPRAATAAPKQDAKSVETARQLFYRALALQDRGKWAEALELLEKVAEIRESAQVRFNIAFDEEHLGRLSAAARGYERAIALAAESGAQNVTRAATERLASLSPRIARLVIRPAEEGISISVDGVDVAPADFGHPVPFEVGDHTVQARGHGRKPYRASLHLPGGETRELLVELEPLDEERPIAVLPALAPERVRAPEPVPPASRSEREARQDESALPYIVGGAAVLSLATAGVFYALRQDALETMHSGCQGGRCPEELRSTDQKGALYTTIANVALATSVGLAGVSAGLFISRGSADDDRPREVSVSASVSTPF
ncbi:MAG TPA: tetratricopeptide repeat protein [Polyangiaceae bacterium]